MTETEIEICLKCNLPVDPEEAGGDCCNHCYRTICEKCLDLEPKYDYYGYNCYDNCEEYIKEKEENEKRNPK